MDSVKIKTIKKHKKKRKRFEEIATESVSAGADVKIKKTKKASIDIIGDAAKKEKKRRKKEIDEDDRNHRSRETNNKETAVAGIEIMKKKPKKKIIEREGNQNAEKKNGKHKTLVGTSPSKSDRDVISKDDDESLGQDDESDADYEEIDAWCNDLDEESNEKYLSITSQIKDLLEKVQYRRQAPQKTKVKEKTVRSSPRNTEQKNKNSKHIHFD